MASSKRCMVCFHTTPTPHTCQTCGQFVHPLCASDSDHTNKCQPMSPEVTATIKKARMKSPDPPSDSDGGMDHLATQLRSSSPFKSAKGSKAPATKNGSDNDAFFSSNDVARSGMTHAAPVPLAPVSSTTSTLSSTELIKPPRASRGMTPLKATAFSTFGRVKEAPEVVQRADAIKVLMSKRAPALPSASSIVSSPTDETETCAACMEEIKQKREQHWFSCGAVTHKVCMEDHQTSCVDCRRDTFPFAASVPLTQPMILAQTSSSSSSSSSSSRSAAEAVVAASDIGDPEKEENATVEGFDSTDKEQGKTTSTSSSSSARSSSVSGLDIQLLVDWLNENAAHRRHPFYLSIPAQEKAHLAKTFACQIAAHHFPFITIEEGPGVYMWRSPVVDRQWLIEKLRPLSGEAVGVKCLLDNLNHSTMVYATMRYTGEALDVEERWLQHGSALGGGATLLHTVMQMFKRPTRYFGVVAHTDAGTLYHKHMESIVGITEDTNCFRCSEDSSTGTVRLGLNVISCGLSPGLGSGQQHPDPMRRLYAIADTYAAAKRDVDIESEPDLPSRQFAQVIAASLPPSKKWLEKGVLVVTTICGAASALRAKGGTNSIQSRKEDMEQYLQECRDGGQGGKVKALAEAGDREGIKAFAEQKKKKAEGGTAAADQVWGDIASDSDDDEVTADEKAAERRMKMDTMIPLKKRSEGGEAGDRGMKSAAATKGNKKGKRKKEEDRTQLLLPFWESQGHPIDIATSCSHAEANRGGCDRTMRWMAGDGIRLVAAAQVDNADVDEETAIFLVDKNCNSKSCSAAGCKKGCKGLQRPAEDTVARSLLKSVGNLKSHQKGQKERVTIFR